MVEKENETLAEIPSLTINLSTSVTGVVERGGVAVHCFEN